MFKQITGLAFAVATALAGFMTPAQAELKDILDAGKIRIGVTADVQPFGFLDENNEKIGLDVDVAGMIAEAMGVDLELVTVTSANRISYLATNRIDLTIAAMGATPERALQINFSSPYSALSIGLFGPEGSGVDSLAEVGDKSIAVARGTTQDIELTARAPDANISRYDDDATAASAYLSGQNDLFATANIIASSLTQRDPDNPLMPIEMFRYSPAHVGVPKGSPELLQWVNTFVFYNINNGVLSDLTEKWLGTPLPENFPSL